MNIKDLKIFRKPSTKIKLAALSLSGIMIMTSLSGCNNSIQSLEPKNNVVQYSNDYLPSNYSRSADDEYTEKTFSEAELNLFVSNLAEKLEVIYGIDLPEGFEIKAIYPFGDRAVLIHYVNTTDIVIKQYVDDDGNIYYRDFGTPIVHNNVKTKN